jgi:hypothetical protein
VTLKTCDTSKVIIDNAEQLNHYLGSGGNKKLSGENEKLPLRRFPAVGVVP